MASLIAVAAFIEQLARLAIDHGVDVPADLDEYRIGLPTVQLCTESFEPDATGPFLFVSTDHGAREWWPDCREPEVAS